MKMHTSLPAELSVILSRVPLQMKPMKMYEYRFTKNIKLEEINEQKWKDIKSLIEKDLRRKDIPKEGLKDFGNAVCTGQEIISKVKLPFLLGGMFGGKAEESHVLIDEKAETERVLEIPRDLSIMNFIIGQGFEKEFVRKGAAEFVMDKGTPVIDGVEKFVTISPSVVVHERDEMFLELNVRWSLAPSGNDWWKPFIGWSKKNDKQKQELLSTIKAKHARTRHHVKGGRGVQGVTILGVQDKCVSDPMSDRDGETTTFQQYFKSEYKFDLHPDGPLLKCRFSGTRKLMIYPAEILQPLFIVNLKSVPAQLCAMYPAERFTHISDVLKAIKSNSTGKYLADYGLNFAANLVSKSVARADVLPCPKIFFPSGKTLDPTQYPEQLGFIKEMGPSNVRHQAQGLPQLLCLNENQVGEVVKFLSQLGLKMNTGKADIRNVKGGNYLYLVDIRNQQSPEYKMTKLNCGQKGVVSQCYWRRLEAVIPKMIALQIAAKTGLFNYTINVRDVAPSFARQDLLIVGVDVGAPSDTRTDRLMTCVAFKVTAGNQWETYCDHSWVETRNKSQQDITVARVTEALKKFLEGAARHFKMAATNPSTIVLCRSPASCGELCMCFNWADLCKSVFTKWNVCVVGTQIRGDTKLAWDSQGAGSVRDFRNVPRGFCIDDNMTVPVTQDNVPTVQQFKGFRLCGANCVLGHANTLLYLVMEMSPQLALADLKKLMYGLCYMYPNMPGALPLPLPIKASMEYNKKFTPLSELKKLHNDMKGTMHYL